MSDRLATYLHDHFSGSTFAVELLKDLSDQHAGEPLSEFAGGLLAEIEEDRKVLQRVIDRVGGEPPALKEAAAWLSERLSRFKLRRQISGDLGTFEALETLGLGILGKRALWRALNAIAEFDARVSGEDYERLAARAESQHASVEERRLERARIAFSPAPA
jgi:hypothetical protein